MGAEIVRIGEENYSRFEDMVFWRENGYERAPSGERPSEAVRAELMNPDLQVYAAEADGRFVGWISLIYLPKIGKWQGRGHVYVDELWVQDGYRRRGIAEALMKKADGMCRERQAHGVRLYVNVRNGGAKSLYEKCGFREDGQALFMEKMARCKPE